jgi:hypothetical protein
MGLKFVSLAMLRVTYYRTVTNIRLLLVWVAMSFGITQTAFVLRYYGEWFVRHEPRRGEKYCFY